MSRPLRVLSLGAGVQSSTLALMYAVGDIKPTIDAAIFADTMHEPTAVYAWLEWLTQRLPYPVHRVTRGDLAADEVKVHTNRTSGKKWIQAKIPAYLRSPTGKLGMLGRRCTLDYKVVPIQREVKRLAGVRRGGQKLLAEVALGISTDEAHRMKPSRVAYIRNTWPLIDAGMSRTDCLAWMRSHGYPEPPRSACVFCPFHSNAEWRRLRDTDSAAFVAAIAFEQALQNAVKQQDSLQGVPFLSRSGTPLASAVNVAGDETGSLFGNECEGLCGV